MAVSCGEPLPESGPSSSADTASDVFSRTFEGIATLGSEVGLASVDAFSASIVLEAKITEERQTVQSSSWKALH